MTAAAAIQERKAELLAEAQVTLQAIRALADASVADPLADPATLARAVSSGILDAPHLRGNAYARGQIMTRIDGRGACVTVEPRSGRTISECQRLAALAL
jgi:hypothetical protein